MSERPTKCFQCGRPAHFEIDPDSEFYEEGWFTCPWCGERLISHEEALGTSARDEEERVKRNLGFYEFRPKRDRT